MSEQDYFSYHPTDDQESVNSQSSTNTTMTSLKQPSASKNPKVITTTGLSVVTSPNKFYTGPLSPGARNLQPNLQPNMPQSPGNLMNYSATHPRLPRRVSSKSVYHSSNTSTHSSAHSSRRPSSGNVTNPSLTALTKSSGGASQHSSPARSVNSNLDALDPPASTPTLIMAPDLASLSTQKSVDVNSPQQTASLLHRNLSSSTSTTSHIPASPTGTISTPSYGLHPSQDITLPSSSTSSTRSIGTNPASSRAFKKQYILNEKIYLDKMRNTIPDDDYYTRRIVLLSSLKDDIDYDETDNDDFETEFDVNNENEVEFANTASNLKSNENIITLSDNFLRHRLQWLTKADSELSTEERNITPTNLFDHPLVSERLKWQTMLSNVLKGDIVKSEKTKIAKEVKNPDFNIQYSEDIWLELKGWMNGKSKEDIMNSIQILKASSDVVFNEIMEFKVPNEIYDDDDKLEEMLTNLINKYFKVTSLWPNLRKMQQEKPITKLPAFSNRVDVIISYLNFKENLTTQINNLKNWVGEKEFDVILQLNEASNWNLPTDCDECQHTRAFAEQIMKEKDIETIFQKKIFFPLAPWILKSKLFYYQYIETIDELNLKPKYDLLELVIMFPIRLVKEIILIRLDYAKKLENPTMMMVDQMLDDFSSYIRLSVQLKYTLNNFISDWPFHIGIDPQFDDTVIEAINYLFNLLHLKILDGTKRSFKTFKEPEVLMKYWEELKNVGQYIDKAGPLISDEFAKLTLRILHRLHAYLLQQQNSPPDFSKKPSDAEKWLIQTFENLGSMKRQLNRFTNILSKAFQNSVTYKINDHKILFRNLIKQGHFLIYTGGNLESEGIYLIGSPELLGCQDQDILDILKNEDIGSDLLPRLEIKNSLSLYNAVEAVWNSNTKIMHNLGQNGVSYYYVSNDEPAEWNPHGAQQIPFRGYSQHTNCNHNKSNAAFEDLHEAQGEIEKLELKLHSLGYILVLCAGESMLWEGEMYNLSSKEPLKMKDFNFQLSPNSLVLMNQGSSYALEYQTDRFDQVAEGSVSFVEKRCSFQSVENNLQKINKAYFRVTYTLLSNYHKFFTTSRNVGVTNDLLNSIFLFTRDFGTISLRTNIANPERKSVIILLLMKLSIGWLSFIADDCDPTDQKTFRWCVPAMEFAMHMTSGTNIVALDEAQFTELKQRISACMSLLISHFDVMGARAIEAEKTTQQGRLNIDIEENIDDEAILQLNSKFRIQAINEMEETMKKNPRQIGKVLDDADIDNKYLLSLASSLSNVTIRWKKRNFVGGGTFGTVFSAINLDNGEILAVKEIKIPDSNAMKKVFPLIKEEMTVLEMLNHPNVVQYYGVEVHRDKVNIFMEYCEGGSLASLLEHGRIEDEMVTQVYTLELLEGLAYLHQSGVVHRDIKPENILLDFNGIIKYVDFGTAKKIARTETRISTLSKFVVTDTTTETSDSRRSSGDGIMSNSHGGLLDMMGTPMYMAPETITGSTHKGKFGADDVWSLGCVVLEMITGRRPWSNLDNEWAVMYHVAAGHTPQLPTKQEVSPIGRKFLKKCLVQNPNKRATAVELLMDPWIVEIRELAFGPPDNDQQAIDKPIEAKSTDQREK
ncbi:hypothetical protein KAFR_0F04340 [Kazachstania africana CBS 2517]|uniref:Protein kinase domain-containing protein n=1 Tax=Kazachstania africana (strain ATCC 22294 / BCRC 22015 / CBS 2517 / CECT 1963 / NBRC 1671 / NRRL Y-8276) TaxID=1071382 RepID=H2AXC9_KAZAF|nr:hypothetical protein KAFR_0F04340 [Kazachstania africana CBS 2517]CCF59029.1 hypothetical protein KAFR_0F04340 [Kazachstania africana CBS 2517]